MQYFFFFWNRKFVPQLLKQFYFSTDRLTTFISKIFFFIGAVRRPLEDGTYFTPAKTNEKFEYYTEHYSPDPYVAAAQREEWMSSNAGNGLSPNPSLSRKSKNQEVKGEKENVKVLKKSNVRHAKHVNKNKQ